MARLPALPELHRREDEDQDQNPVGPVDDERQQRDEAEHPQGRVDRRDDPPAVEWHDRQQVEQVDEEPEEGDRLQAVRVLGCGDRVDAERTERTEQRSGDRQLELLPGALRMLLQEDARPEERNEERRADGQALAFRLEPVTHLVDEDQPDQSDAEPDAAEPDVGAERDEETEQELELEDPDAELGDERRDRRKRRPDLAAEFPPVRPARLDRLVVAKVAR